ncbi:MAG: UvrD-helicase domain-containing protein [Alphaproteobacteria bacterium]
MLVEGVRPERILCITYTKAAAAEMANRVDTELARWAVAADEKLVATLQRADRRGAGRAPA